MCPILQLILVLGCFEVKQFAPICAHLQSNRRSFPEFGWDMFVGRRQQFAYGKGGLVRLVVEGGETGFHLNIDRNDNQFNLRYVLKSLLTTRVRLQHTFSAANAMAENPTAKTQKTKIPVVLKLQRIGAPWRAHWETYLYYK